MALSDFTSILSTVASIGVISMTYHVYISNLRHNTIDNYLKQIIILFYKIEDDYRLLKQTRSDSSLEQCYRRLETNATLMHYYIRKFPIKYKDKRALENVIESLSHLPECDEDYNILIEKFKTFCKEIEKLT